MSLLKGGQSTKDFFRVKEESGTSTIVQGLSGDTEATAQTHKAFELVDEFESTSYTFKSEYYAVDYDVANKQDDDTLSAALAAVAKPSAAASGATPWKNERGVEYDAASSSGEKILSIDYGGIKPDGTLMKVVFALGGISPDSGSFTQKAGENSSPTFKFTGGQSLNTLTIPKGLLRTDVIDVDDAGTPATFEIAKDEGVLVAWLKPAA